ncbi:ISL3 family transposase [Microbacterium sp.]|uniref:ISL3 family transposase n=1 Tax=Microbacterium sp. TaxID=51671 RepID=UPI00262E84F6|nr:ISL3 family transposase [Microbacterium sp.]
MRNATPPCLDSFCRLDRLGLTVRDQIVHPDHSVLVCTPTTPAGPCPACAGPGSRHDTVVRKLAHVPFGWKPTILQVIVPRYRCRPCGRVWRHDVCAAAPTRGKLSRDAVTLAVKHIVLDRLSIARIAAILGVAWNTCSDAILAAADELLFHDPTRLDGVTTIGVDEHVWRHTRFGDKFVTVIIDLTPTRTNTGPSRLLAVVEGRSKQALKQWLQQQSESFRDGVEIVAMDGFTGYKSATVETIDDVTTVMDPFHVVALAGEKLDRCRQRLQQETLGHRGRSQDPLYGIRRIARTRAALLTKKQWFRLLNVFDQDCHTPFAVSWEAYQRVIDAYQADQPAEGKKIMTRLITSLQSSVPTGLEELRSLGHTMKRALRT